MKIIKRYLPKPKFPDTPLDWRYLRSREVLCLIQKLLDGEMVNQVNNNCGVSKITNAISHIRKYIGYENIMNVRIEGVKCDYYELVRTPKNIAKLAELKEIISARLREPLKRGKR